MPSPHHTQSAFASASPLNLPSSATKAASSSSSSNAPAAGFTGDTSMLFIGQPCTEATCHREDFLPLTCSNCGSCFCASHFNPASHRCSYSLHPERKGHGVQGDFLVPICPLCNEVPKGWKREELQSEADIEKVLIRHIETLDCTALLENGKRRNVAASGDGRPSCSEKKCGKKLVVDIRCEKCRKQFCPSHRAPNQHRCGVTATAVTAVTKAPEKSAASATSGNAGLAAMKRLAISGSGSGSGSGGGKTTAKDSAKASTTSSSSPFNIATRIEDKKVDRRAQSEQVSQLRSLESRKARGFKLSAKEEERYEELKRQVGGSGLGGGLKGKIGSSKKDGDCVVC